MHHTTTLGTIFLFMLVLSACKKETLGPQPLPGAPPSTLTVTDVDGHVYRTVVIGEQVWMAEDLRTSRYRDGSPVAHVTSDAAWPNTSSGAWCFYENNSDLGATYGKLYNWYAASDARICPQGWHVPTDADWQRMEAALGVPANELALPGWRGVEQNIGGHMKAAVLWEDPNTSASNESGFHGLPGGARNFHGNGNFSSLGRLGHWWSASDAGTGNAWAHTLHNNNAGIARFSLFERNGSCVRCVMD